MWSCWPVSLCLCLTQSVTTVLQDVLPASLQETLCRYPVLDAVASRGSRNALVRRNLESRHDTIAEEELELELAGVGLGVGLKYTAAHADDGTEAEGEGANDAALPYGSSGDGGRPAHRAHAVDVAGTAEAVAAATACLVLLSFNAKRDGCTAADVLSLCSTHSPLAAGPLSGAADEGMGMNAAVVGPRVRLSSTGTGASHNTVLAAASVLLPAARSLSLSLWLLQVRDEASAWMQLAGIPGFRAHVLDAATVDLRQAAMQATAPARAAARMVASACRLALLASTTHDKLAAHVVGCALGLACEAKDAAPAVFCWGSVHYMGPASQVPDLLAEVGDTATGRRMRMLRAAACKAKYVTAAKGGWWARGAVRWGRVLAGLVCAHLSSPSSPATAQVLPGPPCNWQPTEHEPRSKARRGRPRPGRAAGELGRVCVARRGGHGALDGGTGAGAQHVEQGACRHAQQRG